MAFNVFSSGFVAVFFIALMKLTSGQTQLVKCFQCNVFSKGKQQECVLETSDPESLIVSDCLACLKTYTFTSIHDRWFNQANLYHRFRRSMNYESKYCLREIEVELVKPNGCYLRKGPNGFTEQCFCTNDLCNTSSKVGLISLLSLIALIGLVDLTIRNAI